MLYLARKLTMPSGQVLSRYVVCVDDGVVMWWTPFETECQSMIFIEELLISPEPGLSLCHTDGTIPDDTGVLYLYEVKPDRELVRVYS